jgi:hypothetical protein
MGRRIVRRLALAVVCIGSLAACIVNLSFDMDQSGILLQSPGGPVSQSALIDLGNSSDVRAHKDDIRSLDLESVDVTITNLNPGNLAQTLTGTLSLRKALDDASSEVKVGDLTSFQIERNGRQRINGNPALDAFLLERLHDGGTFYLLVNGTTDAKTDIVLEVVMHASMGYETGLF